MTFYRSAAVLAASLLASVAPVSAQTAAADAQLFGQREGVLGATLSPDGQWIAYIAPGSAGNEILYVVDLANDPTPKPILLVADAKEDLSWCSWANNERLICSLYVIQPDVGVLLGATRLFAIDRDGGNVRKLTQEASLGSLAVSLSGGSIIALDVEGKDDKILMTQNVLPEKTTGTLLANTKEGLAVAEVDIADGRHKIVERPREGAEFYIADADGRVRLMALRSRDQNNYIDDRQLYFFRTKQSDKWLELATSTQDSQTVRGFYPIAVDSDLDVVFGFDDHNGRRALYSISLDGNRTKKLVLANDRVDVDDLMRIGRQRRVVGASYATEQREAQYFDTELKALVGKLASALPGNPAIGITGASESENRLLLIASSDKDPGTLYLYDKSTKQLSPLMPLRPGLAGRETSTMEPISFPAGDGTLIPGYLSLPPGSDGKNLPTIVLPHGGPSARDEWGFDWLAQFFTARGYAVLQPNFRGSSGYGSDWFLNNGFQSWKVAIGDVNDAGRWLVSQGIADPNKLAIVGWSYGGYAALQSQVLDPELYKAVVAIAPVTDLVGLREDARDFSDYHLVADFIGEGPHLREGSPAENADVFEAPVLLFHGDYDQNVKVTQSRRMQSALERAGKKVKYHEFHELDHYIDDADARPQMLAEIDAFLTKALKK